MLTGTVQAGPLSMAQEGVGDAQRTKKHVWTHGRPRHFSVRISVALSGTSQGFFPLFWGRKNYGPT